MKAVDIDGLSFYFKGPGDDDVKALDRITLELEAGKKIAFLGANGSGKTTLFYHLNGLMIPQEGKVEVFGTSVTKKTRKELIRKVGVVFENPDNQLFSTTVYDDVAFAPRNYGFSEQEVQNKVSYHLNKVQAEELAQKSPYNLSWGQKKRAAIAATLAIDPDILVFDEPFSGLDPHVSNHLVALLDQLYQEKRTIIMGTHNVDLAYSWADEVVILSRGKVMKKGPVDILSDETLMKEVYLDRPLLAKLFEETPYSPKSTPEAKKIIRQNVIGK